MATEKRLIGCGKGFKHGHFYKPWYRTYKAMMERCYLPTNGNNLCYCVNREDPDAPSWRGGFVSRLIHEMYPITMPYFPVSKPMVVFCTEGLSDPKNGDFDTIGIWYVLKSDGEKETIEKFFKESQNGWDEISKQEYFDRVGGTDND